MDIFIPRNPKTDKLLSAQHLKNCTTYFKSISESIIDRYPVVPVGSEAPASWSCGYGKLAGYSDGSFGWGAREDSSVIKPGHSLGGFALTSYGLPGIRDILIQPDVDTSRLPPEYSENIEKTVALENKVKWTGKTIGPKAPPKTLDPGKFLQYLEALNHQAADLGWIKGKGIERRLDGKLRLVEKGIDKQNGAFAKPFLRSFIKEVQMLKRHHLTEEGYALLYYNGQYLLDHLPEEKRKHEDKHHSHHGNARPHPHHP